MNRYRRLSFRKLFGKLARAILAFFARLFGFGRAAVALAAKGAVAVAALPVAIVADALRAAKPGAPAQALARDKAAAAAAIEQRIGEKLARKPYQPSPEARSKARELLFERTPAHAFALGWAQALAAGKPMKESAFVRFMGDERQCAWIAMMTKQEAATLLALPPGAVSDHIHGRRKHPALRPMDTPAVVDAAKKIEDGRWQFKEALEARRVYVLEDDEGTSGPAAPAPAW